MPISRIKTDGIQDDAVTTAKVADDAVTTALIADDAITSSKIGVDVIAAEDLAANSITVSEITDGAITTAKINDGAVTMAKLATSGTLPALDGSNLTGVGVAGISSNSTSGTALGIDANNIVTIPSVPAWRVGLSSNQNVSVNNTNVTVEFDNSTTDNCFLQGGLTLSSGIITVPVAGVYQVNVTIRQTGVSGGYVLVRILRNNVTTGSSGTYIIDGTTVTYTNYTGSDIFKCDANDTLRATVLSYSDNIYSIVNTSIFSGHLIG